MLLLSVLVLQVILCNLAVGVSLLIYVLECIKASFAVAEEPEEQLLIELSEAVLEREELTQRLLEEARL